MSAKTYLRILQGGLLASLIIVFFVFKDLLFPFITSKQLTFNILMEFLLAVWLVFIMRYPEYRPKRSYLTWGLAAYFLAILISCFTSVNFIMSFWGNTERMLGLFDLLHFFIFYLILITVFRTWSQWRTLLQGSVWVAVAVALYGLFGPNPYSTIGNTAYVSGYLIFNIYFAALLFGRSDHRGVRWFYVLAILIMLPAFWACHTSGAIIGLFSSILLLFLLLGLTHRRPGLRKTAWGVLLVAVLGVIVIFSQYQDSWFQHSFLRNLTPEKATFQTRLIAWQAAAQDFPNHWLLGTGLGNFAITFDKYFKPSFYNYATTDTYFDRAHDNLIDIASTTGIVGLLTYLSIFAAALYYLIKKFKEHGGRVGTGDEAGRRNLEIVVIIALLAAYFVQNLAVFDSYVTYIGLMMVLGFIYWLTEGGGVAEAEDKKHWLTIGSGAEWWLLIILLLATYFFTNAYNLRPWRTFQGVITGYGNLVEGNFAAGLAAYRQALTGSPWDHDGRVTLINLFTLNSSALSSLSASDRESALNFIIAMAQADVANNPQDSLNLMQLAQTYDTASQLEYEAKNIKLTDQYSQEALSAINRSLAASPGRVPVYLLKAQIQLERGDASSALSTINYAISLNPDYYSGYCRLAQFDIFLKDQGSGGVKEADIKAPLDACIDKGGVGQLNSNNVLGAFLNYLIPTGDYARALPLAEQLANLNGSNANIWLNLAKLYYITGNDNQAQVAAKTAINLDSSLGSPWTQFMAAFNASASSSSVKTPTSTPGGR